MFSFLGLCCFAFVQLCVGYHVNLIDLTMNARLISVFTRGKLQEYGLGFDYSLMGVAEYCQNDAEPELSIRLVNAGQALAYCREDVFCIVMGDERCLVDSAVPNTILRQ